MYSLHHQLSCTCFLPLLLCVCHCLSYSISGCGYKTTNTEKKNVQKSIWNTQLMEQFQYTPLNCLNVSACWTGNKKVQIHSCMRTCHSNPFLTKCDNLIRCLVLIMVNKLTQMYCSSCENKDYSTWISPPVCGWKDDSTVRGWGEAGRASQDQMWHEQQNLSHTRGLMQPGR